MTEIASVIMILGAVAAAVLLLWLWDKSCAEENENRLRRHRAALREDKRFENEVWEITTRVNDDRSDLFRKYAELEVR